MNIKTFVLTLGLIVTAISFSHADMRGVPRGQMSALATADYGGVSFSTFSVSSAAVQLFTGQGVYHGVNCGSISDSTEFFYIIRDTQTIIGGSGLTTAGADYTATNEIYRVTVSTNLDYTADGRAIREVTTDVATKIFVHFPRFPIRVIRGAVFKMSTVGPTSCTAFWTAED